MLWFHFVDYSSKYNCIEYQLMDCFEWSISFFFVRNALHLEYQFEYSQQQITFRRFSIGFGTSINREISHFNDMWTVIIWPNKSSFFFVRPIDGSPIWRFAHSWHTRFSFQNHQLSWINCQSIRSVQNSAIATRYDLLTHFLLHISLFIGVAMACGLTFARIGISVVRVYAHARSSLPIPIDDNSI